VTDRHVIQQALSLGPQGLTVLAAPPSPELADYVTTAHLRSLVAELRSTFELVVADTTSQLSEITLEALENSGPHRAGHRLQRHLGEETPA